MKNLLILIVASLVIFTVSCKSNVDSINEESQVDIVAPTSKKVKTLHKYNVESNKKELVSIEYYDKEGRVTKSTGIVGDGEIYHTYSYDDKGNEIEEVYTDQEKTFKRITSTTYEYEGNQIKKLVSMENDGDSPSKKVMEETFEYNSKGQVFKKKSIGAYFTNNYEYSYFLNGKVKQEIDISDEGNSKSVLNYDENGEVIKQELFSRSSTSEDFKLDQTNTWEFKDDGTVYSETIKDGKVTYQNTSPQDKDIRMEYTYYE